VFSRSPGESHETEELTQRGMDSIERKTAA